MLFSSGDSCISDSTSSSGGNPPAAAAQPSNNVTKVQKKTHVQASKTDFQPVDLGRLRCSTPVHNWMSSDQFGKMHVGSQTSPALVEEVSSEASRVLGELSNLVASYTETLEDLQVGQEGLQINNEQFSPSAAVPRTSSPVFHGFAAHSPTAEVAAECTRSLLEIIRKARSDIEENRHRSASRLGALLERERSLQTPDDGSRGTPGNTFTNENNYLGPITRARGRVLERQCLDFNTLSSSGES